VSAHDYLAHSRIQAVSQPDGGPRPTTSAPDGGRLPGKAHLADHTGRECAAGTRIPILLYHSVAADPPGWIARFAVTPQIFAQHIDLIVESGRTAMTVSELREALHGRAALPSKPLVVTFDDGFADYAEAAAMLAAHSIPSTVYVTTGALRGRGPRPREMEMPPGPMLEWSQLAEISGKYVEIGAHSHTHRQLDVLRPREAFEEIRRPKDLLEDELGHEIFSFAYPYGFSSARVRRAVQAAGYGSACGVMEAFSSGLDQSFSLARLTVRATTTPRQVAAWLAGYDAPVAPYPEKLRTKLWRTYRRVVGWKAAA
jgi:peptidoglycan/xylan/chitin deacetylase (PgdA/CDA1 family)